MVQKNSLILCETPLKEPPRIVNQKEMDSVWVCVCVYVCVPPFLPLIERHTMFTEGLWIWTLQLCSHSFSCSSHNSVGDVPDLQGLKAYQIFHRSSFKELSCIIILQTLWTVHICPFYRRQSAGHYRPLVLNGWIFTTQSTFQNTWNMFSKCVPFMGIASLFSSREWKCESCYQKSCICNVLLLFLLCCRMEGGGVATFIANP